ncbi:MAG: hypothetical protein N3A65_08760 [candidate division WOR-3 bacterium]|nr:hypothetical protein [candidate division WOR-3 bacterium]
MGPAHLYEVKMIDGSRYRGEIAYRDDKMIVLKLNRYDKSGIIPKIRLFYNGIMSIQELGWRRRF